MFLLQALLVALFVVCHARAWRCPTLAARPAAECSCDMPRTLRCAGDHTALQIIGKHLREQSSPTSQVALLDCALRGVGVLTQASLSELQGSGLQGLVISSGEIRRVQQHTFLRLPTLMAIGLPNNQLPEVPTEALLNLPKLNRLDLSYNKISIIDDGAFKGLSNLTYIDVSDNQLKKFSPDTFKPLYKLSILRLRGNQLDVDSLETLQSAKYLKELDLSSNQLGGPLGPNTVPALKSLATLNLDDNTFASVKRGALVGLSNLTSLSLHNNQIDVLEDHAFRHLSNLTHLDLSRNEIVAVSGSSLAHLDRLETLDLSHNFLRSLSAEPLGALTKLSQLFVHDNDISMVDEEALAGHRDLKRFTVQDNPLNCDCLMASFARWLREAKDLVATDRSAAVCATPPHLEGALLSRLSKSKLCDEQDVQESMDDKPKTARILLDIVKDYNMNENLTTDIDRSNLIDEPNNFDYNDGEEQLFTSKATATLTKAWYTPTSIHFSFSIKDRVPRATYNCEGISLQADSRADDVKVNGHEMRFPCRGTTDDVSVTAPKLDPGLTYRVCIALEETPPAPRKPALLLSCSVLRGVDIAASPSHGAGVLKQELHSDADVMPLLRLSEVRSNLTSDGTLTIFVSVLGFRTNTAIIPDYEYMGAVHSCYIVATVHSDGNLVAQRDTPCRERLVISMDGFVRGPYEVCSHILKQDTSKICVTPQYIEDVSILSSNFKMLNFGLILLCMGLLIVVLVLIWFSRKVFRKPKVEEHRCVAQNVAEEAGRASYVILTATSKL